MLPSSKVGFEEEQGNSKQVYYKVATVLYNIKTFCG